ncbi:glycosyltransferase [Flavobacterium cyanobacteriorum]|uniref:Glycosyltransferase n=1 Tax=Flavobacterium cyanobacteriorum TaxID=2022802 RepID=A0A255YVD8_9FLAO|nr:glycosyltransferase [Flavobacterium cyanobacteriorum]OYQ33178.1 glycosyltransferase [Flavobacterium cyanobacteriorum]
MNIVLFYHSLASDWNHGNAHFLRGTVKELLKRGHNLKVYEPEGNWSLANLVKDHGKEKAQEFTKYYPMLKARFYNPVKPDYDAMLKGADLVIVHEWNEPELVATVGELKDKYGYKLLFHDTHHRAVSEVESMGKYDFANYDGCLAFGEVISNIYRNNKWIEKVWTWHEAADAGLFKPQPSAEKEGDLVWIGNWGDNERTEELMEFLIKPVKELKLKAKVYGVRYPDEALRALKDAGIEYGGWLPNYKAPEVFAKYKVTVHVPRGPYVKWLPGIPTIRPFEALSCGITLVSSPWDDAENLFTPGEDFHMAKNSEEMKAQLQRVLFDEGLAQKLAERGRKTILARHTCAHRVNELEDIMKQLGFNEALIYPMQTKTLEA